MNTDLDHGLARSEFAQFLSLFLVETFELFALLLDAIALLNRDSVLLAHENWLLHGSSWTCSTPIPENSMQL